MRSSKSQFKEHVLGLWQETKGQRHQQHFRMLPAVPCWTQLPYSKLGMRANKHIIEDRYHHHIDVQSMCMPYQRKIPAVFPDSKEASLCHPLGSQTDSPTLWFAPVLNKVIEMCETPQKLCNNCKSRITQGELKIRKVIFFFFITGLWMCDSHPSSLTCHNTAQRTVPPGWRLVTAARQCSSYLTCKLMPKPDWLTPFSKWRRNAFWGCRLNIGWHTN